jgi:NAD(P)-dependent dehydrogenase (short-subunit alcohol dehydrogenase family)
MLRRGLVVNRYASRVVLITGAGRGPGAGMARRFAEGGATVPGCDVHADRLDGSVCADMSTVDVADSAQVDGWNGRIRLRHPLSRRA